MIEKPLSDHARIKELESALTALREERDQIKSAWEVLFQAHAELVNKDLLTRRDSEGDSPRQPAAPTDGGSTRFVWLMERYTGYRDENGLTRTKAGTLVYWDGGHAESFTTDPYAAMQWPTKEAAMVACPPEHYAQWGWQIVCHGFMEPPSSDARLTELEKGKASGSATEPDLRDLRMAIAHLTEEREGLRNEAIKLRMRIGSMEDDAALQRSHERNAQACHEKQLAALTEVHERLREIAERFHMASKRMRTLTGDEKFDHNRAGQSEAYFACARELDALRGTQR